MTLGSLEILDNILIKNTGNKGSLDRMLVHCMAHAMRWASLYIPTRVIVVVDLFNCIGMVVITDFWSIMVGRSMGKLYIDSWVDAVRE